MADPSGRTTTHTYNVAGELLERAFADDTSITYAYDAMGRRVEMVDATGTTTSAYDANGRPVEVAAPAGALGYDYDLAGRRTGLTQHADPNGEVTSYTYDARCLLVATSVTTPAVGGPGDPCDGWS